MASTLITGITHGSKSRISNPQFHPGFDEQYNDNDPRNRRGNNDDHLWVCIKQMEWGKHNPYISLFRRYCRYRFSIYPTYSWRSFHFRDSRKSSQPSPIRRSNRQRNRRYCYYGLLISLLTIAPVRAEEGDRNVSNPVAAATGNVTNQAVQFQNNGAPSRQHYGPNISCNGSTMTFSPFYMGNQTTPFDETMAQQTYTVAENWGFQVNFMVPLDKKGLQQCRDIATRQEEKMRLDYELVRVLKCAELQQKGFMLKPLTRVSQMCSDVIPIKTWEKAKKKVLKCNTPPKPWYKPWSKPKETCNMSSLTLQRKDTTPNLDGPNDLQPEVKTSRIIEKEAVKPAPKKTSKKTTEE